MRRFNLFISVLFILGFLAQGSLGVAAQKADAKARAGHVVASDIELNKLFASLKQARGEAQARSIEADIWAHWTRSGVPAIDRLMKQAKLLASRGHYEPSLGLLDRIIFEQPSYSEGWNRKATVLFFMMRDDE